MLLAACGLNVLQQERKLEILNQRYRVILYIFIWRLLESFDLVVMLHLLLTMLDSCVLLSKLEAIRRWSAIYRV